MDWGASFRLQEYVKHFLGNHLNKLLQETYWIFKVDALVSQLVYTFQDIFVNWLSFFILVDEPMLSLLLLWI